MASSRTIRAVTPSPTGAGSFSPTAGRLGGNSSGLPVFLAGCDVGATDGAAVVLGRVGDGDDDRADEAAAAEGAGSSPRVASSRPMIATSAGPAAPTTTHRRETDLMPPASPSP